MSSYQDLLDGLWGSHLEICSQSIHKKITPSQEAILFLQLIMEMDMLLINLYSGVDISESERNDLAQTALGYLACFLLAASQSFYHSSQFSSAAAFARECLRLEPTRLEARQQLLETMGEMNDLSGIIA